MITKRRPRKSRAKREAEKRREDIYAVAFDVARQIGADSLGYLPPEALAEMADGRGICSACFDERYPTKIPADTRKDRFEQKISAAGGPS